MARRFPDTHFVIAKWETNLSPLEKTVREAVAGRGRTAPFDLLRFQSGDAERFIDAAGNVALTHDDLSAWMRVLGDKA